MERICHCFFLFTHLVFYKDKWDSAFFNTPVVRQDIGCVSHAHRKSGYVLRINFNIKLLAQNAFGHFIDVKNWLLGKRGYLDFLPN